MSEPAATLGQASEAGLRAPPRHVAIIMDGNGRWAKSRGLPRALGHKEGVEALRKTVDCAWDLGITHLSVYAFSTENWTRPPDEIAALFELLKMFVKRDLARLHKEGVRIRIIGSRDKLQKDILELVDHAQELTKDNQKLTLNIAFNYGGKAEIVDAMRKAAVEVAAGRMKPEDITEQTVSRLLWTADSPDPDLLIRTSGELRLSNFLLWSGAYSELMFLDVWWPDFDRTCLEQAIDAFRRRDRRFGGLGA